MALTWLARNVIRWLLAMANLSNLRRELPGILEDAANELTAAALDRSTRALVSRHDVVRCIDTVLGTGYLSAAGI